MHFDDQTDRDALRLRHLRPVLPQGPVRPEGDRRPDELGRAPGGGQAARRGVEVRRQAGQVPDRDPAEHLPLLAVPLPERRRAPQRRQHPGRLQLRRRRRRRQHPEGDPRRRQRQVLAGCRRRPDRRRSSPARSRCSRTARTTWACSRAGVPEQSGKWTVATAPYSKQPGSYLGGTGSRDPDPGRSTRRRRGCSIQYLLRPENADRRLHLRRRRPGHDGRPREPGADEARRRTSAARRRSRSSSTSMATSRPIPLRRGLERRSTSRSPTPCRGAPRARPTPRRRSTRPPPKRTPSSASDGPRPVRGRPRPVVIRSTRP